MPQERFWRLGRLLHWGTDAALRAAHEWRETFDAIDSPIFVLDAEGRVTRINLAARNLLGLEFRDILGRQAGDLATWEPWRAVAEVARLAVRAGAGASRQVRGERGKEWHVSANLVQGEAAGAVRIIVLARDVTAVVRLEASLRRVEAMATLGTLVSGVAHEVRNPLFAISATVDALEARAAGRAELGPFAAALRGEVDRLSRLMRDLLEYGKPAALELVDADIGQVVATALRAVEATAAARGVAIENRVAPELPRLRVDPDRLVQVVLNLVDNAVLHAPRGSAVELRGAVVGAGGSRRIEISVVDRGPGFAPADLPHVFEPFFTRRKGGTGLGLAIVKRLVEDQGGSVDVRNRRRGGAAVSLSLPLPDPPGVDGPGAAGGVLPLPGREP